MTVIRAVEIDLVDTLAVQVDGLPAHGSRPRGTLRRSAGSLETIETLRFSDMGYVDENHVPYVPIVTQAFDLDRGISLTSDALGGTSSFGSVTLINDGSLDALVASRTNDHLPIRILSGRKIFDRDRGIWQDPKRADLQPVFAGLGTLWQPGRRTLTVPLLGALSWLDVTMAGRIYGGTGRLDGDANVSGRVMPTLRGTACNITPVLIDAVNYVYQVSDAPAEISALYEGGFAGGIAFGGLVADLYAQSPAPGTYQIQRGGTGTWIRLGTRPVYGITVDAVGSFPSGAAPQNVLDILRTMLLEDFVLPESYIDVQWPAQSPLAPWRAGWFWDGTETVTGQDVVRTLLSGLALSIVPTRSGTLRPVLLEAVDDLTASTLTLDATVITDIQSVSLDASLSPPTWRWRMGWQHNFTVQTAGSGLHPQAPADRQALIAMADRNAVWSDASLRMRWRLPSDPTPVVTALAFPEDAQTVADSHGRLWGLYRTLWAVTIPVELSWQVDLGDTITIQAPVPELANPCLGVVVAEHVRGGDATATLQILTLWTVPQDVDGGDFGPDIM
ncbi:hypothetical protein GCM10007866_13720 [Gluconobacter albidus]|uniref:Tip attachment protein J domain-containing protein n=3 Tax=Gluconobacter albidus TaxID=318683 RepID=A0ABQ5WZC8_9PROT|nr:hypothetical protein [Gluconobacter albidus]GBQ93875.1 hypothetical protein AA3250_2938 [Gluconobacter albidus NBRC 3250]GLQ68921.1 hypothetical protein GCM10007866_13720 [Gluconobacter albidus]